MKFLKNRKTHSVFHYFVNSTLRYCLNRDNHLLILGILEGKIAIWQKRGIRWNGVSFLLFCTVFGLSVHERNIHCTNDLIIGLYENGPVS